MDVSVSEAKAQLTELVRRAEAGEEIVLTRFGRPAARLVPAVAKPGAAARRAILERVRTAGTAKARSGAAAARSQDFLYDEAGLPK
jgi:prevent-host-death family protein